MISRTIVASLWKVSIYCGLVSIVILQSCTPKVATSSSGSHSEDLSKYRPSLEEYTPLKAEDLNNGNNNATTNNVVYPEPTNHIKEELDQVVQMTVDYNKSRGYYNGYSIQVYSGIEVKEAHKVEDRLSSLGYNNHVTKFDSPIYRTKIGRYYTRLEANKDFNEIKRNFPLAVLVSEKFRIK